MTVKIDPTFAVKSICLEDIERKAEWCRYDAEDMLRYTNLLVSLSDWQAGPTEEVLTKSLKNQIAAVEATVQAIFMIAMKRTTTKELEYEQR